MQLSRVALAINSLCLELAPAAPPVPPGARGAPGPLPSFRPPGKSRQAWITRASAEELFPRIEYDCAWVDELLEARAALDLVLPPNWHSTMDAYRAAVGRGELPYIVETCQVDREIWLRLTPRKDDTSPP